MADQIERAAHAICQSGKFETGQGTCAARCLDILGNARGGAHGCPHAVRIHGDFARMVLEASQ